MVAKVRPYHAASDQLMANMTRVFRELKAIMREEADRQGLSMTQFIALRVLDTRGNVTMSELRDCLDITQGAATTVVDKLLARGLVARVADASDRRLVLVRSTDAGTSLMQSVLTASQIHIDRILGKFGIALCPRFRHRSGFLASRGGRRTEAGPGRCAGNR